MAIAVRQEKSAQGGAVASLAVTLTSTTLAGSVVVVAASMGGGTDITFTDDKSDTPTDSGSGLFAGLAGNSRMAAFLVTTTGAQVFTAHYTGSPTFTEVVAWEVTGLTSAAFDKHVHATADSTSASSGSTGALSSATEIGLGYIFTTNAMSTGTEGAGWAEDEITPGNNSMVQHIITASTAAVTAIGTVTPTAANWDAWAVTLQSAGGDTLGGAMPLLMM